MKHEDWCSPTAIAISIFLIVLPQILVALFLAFGPVVFDDKSSSYHHQVSQQQHESYKGFVFESERVYTGVGCLFPGYEFIHSIIFYSLGIMSLFFTCCGTCCAGKLGMYAVEAALINLLVIAPLNITLWILYRVLTPIRWIWRHLLNWLLIPFISIFHMHPSFIDSTLQNLIVAIQIPFNLGGMSNILDGNEHVVRKELRNLISKIFPNIQKWVPDFILTSTLFRVLLGFAMTPLAWWMVDEIYGNWITGDEIAKGVVGGLSIRKDNDESEGYAPIGSYTIHKETGELIAANQNHSHKNHSKAVDDVKNHTENQGNEAEATLGEQQEDPTKENKALAVSFVFPKCKFLFEARKAYSSHYTGNRVCLRECRLLVEELTGQLLGHQFKVLPNLKTGECTFCITSKKFDPNLDW